MTFISGKRKGQGMNANRRRQTQRWIAARSKVRQELKDEFWGPQAPKCARCKTGLAQGDGSMCHFWHGVAQRRTQRFALVCSVCRHELIRTGPGGDLGMHGVAHHTRSLAKSRTADSSADTLGAMEVLAGRQGAELSRVMRAIVGNSPLKHDSDLGRNC